MKNILIILAVLLPFAAFADNVSQQQAQQIAERFFTSATTRAATPVVKLKWTGNDARTRAEQEPAFYVFDNTSGGFVIVAGDDCVEPILGYSYNGEFIVDGMPANVKYWFDFLQDGIAHLRATNYTPSTEVKAKWNTFRNGAVTRGGTGTGGGKQLETAQWNQGEPYNNKASEWCNFEDKVYTGCTATATAIIMRYHRWPERGTGTLEDYSYTRYGPQRTVKGYELGHKYDWDNMPLTYGSNSTEAQNNAVAQLMLDCGVMVRMSYGTYAEGGSGAAVSKVPTALIEHMDYDRSADVLYRDMYALNKWVDKIIENIDNNCPILMSAFSDYGSGHAFILDGYDSSRNIRINWGWGGYDNGYYVSPDFGEYKYDQEILVNIKPNKGGDYPESIIGLKYYNNSGAGRYINGLEFTDGPTVSDKKVSMTFATGLVYNMGLNPANAKFYIAHADKNDNIKTSILTRDLSLQPGYGNWYNLTYTVDQNNIAFGDKIKMFYQYDNGNITPVWYSEDVVGELLLPYDESAFDLEEDTAVEYSAIEKKLIINTHSGVEWKLTSESGTSAASAAEFNSGKLTIDLKALGDGTYTLYLSIGSSSKTLQFTVGE